MLGAILLLGISLPSLTASVPVPRNTSLNPNIPSHQRTGLRSESSFGHGLELLSAADKHVLQLFDHEPLRMLKEIRKLERRIEKLQWEHQRLEHKHRNLKLKCKNQRLEHKKLFTTNLAQMDGGTEASAIRRLLQTTLPTSNDPTLAPTTSYPTLQPSSAYPTFRVTVHPTSVYPTLLPSSAYPTLAPTTVTGGDAKHQIWLHTLHNAASTACWLYCQLALGVHERAR